MESHDVEKRSGYGTISPLMVGSSFPISNRDLELIPLDPGLRARIGEADPPPPAIAIGRYKRVIGDALRSRTDQTEATEVAIAAAALNRMLAFGHPNYVRIS
jgi:hypothetical protein